jgi:hypothetical protein
MESKLICFLEIIGVGYKANTNPQGFILYLKLGFSHKIRLQVMQKGLLFFSIYYVGMESNCLFISSTLKQDEIAKQGKGNQTHKNRKIWQPPARFA